MHLLKIYFNCVYIVCTNILISIINYGKKICMLSILFRVFDIKPTFLSIDIKKNKIYF